MKRIKSDRKLRNPIAVIMMERYKNTGTIMRHRSDRRPKDAKRSWRNDQEA